MVPQRFEQALDKRPGAGSVHVNGVVFRIQKKPAWIFELIEIGLRVENRDAIATLKFFGCGGDGGPIQETSS